jgi:hypothetical protein
MLGETARMGVRLEGPLGEALDANLHGRLTHFIVDETSPAIALFAPERRALNTEGDWYGEHAGKWLVAAAKAVARSADPALTASLRRVADFLVSVQEPDGYLGTYAPERRFMQPQPPKPLSWNGEPSVRTWDIWTHAYLILGFVDDEVREPSMQVGVEGFAERAAETHVRRCCFAVHQAASTTQRKPMQPERSFDGAISRYLPCWSRRYACGKYQCEVCGW